MQVVLCACQTLTAGVPVQMKEREKKSRGKKKKIEKGRDKKERKKRENIVVMYWSEKIDNYNDGNVT